MKEIMDESMMKRSMKRIAHEILEHNKGADNLVLIGIKNRGDFLAHRLAQNIFEIENIQVPIGTIDIKYWRDDLEEQDFEIPKIDVDLKGKDVVLVDDVLFSGRTIRAGMEGIMHYGRAKTIQLAVLIDRGHRDLPIRADYVGKNVPTSINEGIKVLVKEFDDKDGVYLLNN